MPHNPILRKQRLSRTDLQFVVEHGTVGVLYAGHQFDRILRPGERHSVEARLNLLKDLDVYLVDTKPCELNWRVVLPTENKKHSFAATIKFKYQVSDPRRIVDENITDTDSAIARVLEPILRKVSREFKFAQHSQADTALETEIAKTDFHSACGLTNFDPPDVVINLSEADHELIEKMNAVEKATVVPHPAEHVEDLPSEDPVLKFRVKVNLRYKVTEPEKILSDSLGDAEAQLWPKIRQALRKESRKYSISNIARADAAMEAALGSLVDGGLEDFGVRVENASVDVDLDDETRRQAIELAKAKHDVALEEARRKGLESGVAFYREMLKSGDHEVLAGALAKGEITFEQLHQLLSQKQRERLQMKIELLKGLRADNAKDENQDWRISQRLLDDIIGVVTESSADELAGPADRPQLADSQKKSEEKK